MFVLNIKAKHNFKLVYYMYILYKYLPRREQTLTNLNNGNREFCACKSRSEPLLKTSRLNNEGKVKSLWW